MFEFTGFASNISIISGGLSFSRIIFSVHVSLVLGCTRKTARLTFCFSLDFYYLHPMDQMHEVPCFLIVQIFCFVSHLSFFFPFFMKFVRADPETSDCSGCIFQFWWILIEFDNILFVDEGNQEWSVGGFVSCSTESNRFYNLLFFHVNAW